MFSIPSFGTNARPVQALTMFQASGITQSCGTLDATPPLITRTFTRLTVAIGSTVEVASFYQKKKPEH